jgi:putative aldouronate transport system permease protein
MGLNKVKRYSKLVLLGRRFRKELDYQLMVIPGIIFFLVFCYYPMIGLVMAFQEYQLGNWIIGSPWVGLKQFRNLFSDRQFWNALQNTVCISALNLSFGFIAPIIFALMLNEIRNLPFKKFVQTVSYLPHFISWVIIVSIMTLWLGTDFQGIINIALVKLRLLKAPVLFLSYPEYYYAVAAISSVWKGVGYGSIIYLASIASIDQEIYEAATVDGAGRFRKIWYVTLPSIKTTMAVLLIISVGGLFRGNFDQSYLLMTGFNMSRSDILETYVLRYGINLARYSMSTAASLFQSAVNLVIVFIVNFIIKRLDSEQGLF